MKVTVLRGQSLLDIAVQAAGSVEAVLAIAGANDISITDDLEPGVVLEVPGVVNQAIADYFRVNGLLPKTGVTDQDQQTAPYGGIGYMGIEIDFIIS